LVFQPVGVDLLVFSINYMFPFALTVFVLGATYKISRFIILKTKTTRAPRRGRGAKTNLIGLIRTFLDPIIISLKENPIDFIFGLLLLHIIGTIPLLFLLGGHVAFFSYYFKQYSILWPLALPISPLTSSQIIVSLTLPVEKTITLENVWGALNIVLNGDVLMISVIAALGYKLIDKIYEWRRGVTCIRPWDITSIILLFLIVVTGALAAHHVFESINYRTVLGFHILLADLLLLSVPFTNMWHITFSYIYGKLHEFWDLRYRKGVE